MNEMFRYHIGQQMIYFFKYIILLPGLYIRITSRYADLNDDMNNFKYLSALIYQYNQIAYYMN